MIEWMRSQFLRACADCSRWTQNLLLESRNVRYTPNHRRLGVTAGINAPRLCVHFPLVFVLPPGTERRQTASSRGVDRRRSTCQNVRVLHARDHLPPRRLPRRRPATWSLWEEYFLLARSPVSQGIQQPPFRRCGGRDGRSGPRAHRKDSARLRRGSRRSCRPHRSLPAQFSLEPFSLEPGALQFAHYALFSVIL